MVCSLKQQLHVVTYLRAQAVAVISVLRKWRALASPCQTTSHPLRTDSNLQYPGYTVVPVHQLIYSVPVVLPLALSLPRSLPPSRSHSPFCSLFALPLPLLLSRPWSPLSDSSSAYSVPVRLPPPVPRRRGRTDKTYIPLRFCQKKKNRAAYEPKRVRLHHGARHLAPARPVHEAHLRRPQLLHARNAFPDLRGRRGVARLLSVAEGHAGRADSQRGHERDGLRAEHAHGEEGGTGWRSKRRRSKRVGKRAKRQIECFVCSKVFTVAIV